LLINALAHYPCPGWQLQAAPGQMLVYCATVSSQHALGCLCCNVFPQDISMDIQDSFPQRVWQIVAAIPEGYVTTYGDVAKLAGSPRAARQVGGVLKRLPEGSTLPWHRVVNRHGCISLTGPDLQRQRQALLAEGVVVSGSGQIDLQRYRWIY
jgi:methylated-DNA-protein-cysteine methyltransferase-like protein